MSDEDALDVADAVPASVFTRNFDHYRMLAQRKPIAVSSHGQITGYFLRPDDYEEFRRFKAHHRSFATIDLPAAKVAAISSVRMDERHSHLDALLDLE